MHLFINDIPVTILKPGTEPDSGDINHRLDASRDAMTKATLINNVWIRNVGVAELDLLMDLIQSDVPMNLLTLKVTVRDYKDTKAYFRKKFKVVNAAGGLVVKKDRYLMMLRMKKWDLPKGKKDPGEASRVTAEREVMEECNVQVKVGPRLVTTWHTYTMNRNNMLKRTRWYVMECSDDSKMRPETREEIEELRWMNRKEVYHALENSYNSIRFVFASYYTSLEKPKSRSRAKSKAKPKAG